MGIIVLQVFPNGPKDLKEKALECKEYSVREHWVGMHREQALLWVR